MCAVAYGHVRSKVNSTKSQSQLNISCFSYRDSFAIEWEEKLRKTNQQWNIIGSGEHETVH